MFLPCLPLTSKQPSPLPRGARFPVGRGALQASTPCSVDDCRCSAVSDPRGAWFSCPSGLPASSLGRFQAVLYGAGRRSHFHSPPPWVLINPRHQAWGPTGLGNSVLTEVSRVASADKLTLDTVRANHRPLR